MSDDVTFVSDAQAAVNAGMADPDDNTPASVLVNATPTDDHCTTCCPWYPGPCQGPFDAAFDAAVQGNCNHPDCINFDPQPTYACDHPWECLPWEADTSCDDGFDQLDEALQKRALTLAWRTISTLTGGRIASGCTILRPCLREGSCDVCEGPGLLHPFIDGNGQWQNWPPCRPNDCSCCDLCQIEMPGRVAALLEVNIDGYRHDPRLFRVDNGNLLVRQDGCCWPGCQNLGAPYGYYGTFGIRYVAGIPPRADGLWAVGVLASEFAKACSGGKCRLPSNVTSVSRQGVSFELSTGMFDSGTGIREVDAYIHSLNPNKLKVAPKVWSPDLEPSKHRVTTGQVGGRWP